MEFWKLYRLVKARRWMILGLLLITLLTVFVAKKAVDDQTQYAATAVVLPDYQAMSTQGFFQDNGHGLLSATYSRFDRMALFTTSIRNQFDPAVTLAGRPTLVQKQQVVRALAGQGQLTPDIEKQLRVGSIKSLVAADPTTTPGPALAANLDKVLTYFRVPTDPGLWLSRPDLSAATKAQMLGSLRAAPVVDAGVNTTPGQSTPTPVTTDYLQIGISAPDPVLAQQMANLMAASFINSYYDAGTQEYDNSISTVQSAQKRARAELTRAQDAIVKFKRQNPLVDVASAVSNDVTNLVSLERSRDQATVQLQVAQSSAATYAQLAKTTGTSRTVDLAPAARPQVKQLQSLIADQRASLATLRAQYTDLNPKVVKAAALLKATQGELSYLLSQPYQDASPNAEYTQLLQQEDASKAEAVRAQTTISTLTAQINQQEAQNRTLPAAEKKLAALAEDEQTAQLNMKAAEADTADMRKTSKLLDRGHITLTNVATAAVPDAAGPSLAALLIYGAVLSLIIGIAAALGLDYLDNSVQTVPDAEKLLGMPVSAVIPAIPARADGDGRGINRLVVTDPLSPIAESYRLLRTDLLFTAEQQPFQSLMAATAKPGQGATTTICNLAVALASVGKRVILIDADLRKPKLHDFFGVSNEVGLTTLLEDQCELEEALKVTDIDNLLVLPSGPMSLKPAELLASQKMRALHERLKPHTDFVLVDTPSAIAFSDASILASYLDAVLIVVRAQETPRGSEMQLKALLSKARANVVGVVLNGVKPQLVDSYVYHATFYPQVTPVNGHALPPPSNGSNGSYGPNGANGARGKTLEGDGVAAVVAGEPEDIESTVIMDDFVSIKPPPARGRFSLRKMFNTDDRE